MTDDTLDWDRINRRTELVEVVERMMSRIYPEWTCGDRAEELVTALERFIEAVTPLPIQNVEVRKDETEAVLAESDALSQRQLYDATR